MASGESTDFIDPTIWPALLRRASLCPLAAGPEPPPNSENTDDGASGFALRRRLQNTFYLRKRCPSPSPPSSRDFIKRNGILLVLMYDDHHHMKISLFAIAKEPIKVP
ncbi:predicted protein [Histoplasma capsulatum var. duboisii H88]|uniref:Predicted protein n=1 Tax=Ajellomyces capsulatus (strain H88) TaxID=544711 RepID=F0UK24_AJEC8|nr:predicted protein [Histoplasma capsulatum var. duboisii H88]